MLEIPPMRTAFTEREFKIGLNRLGERDVHRLVVGKALDGDEARWAAEWLSGDRMLAQEPQYEPLKLAS
ncbi:MAG TPA: hypothetical protein VFX95_08875 [Caulobacteraceae bacterium]|nr:hypothetical protein [Caulobacteraceae bacterium]